MPRGTLPVTSPAHDHESDHEVAGDGDEVVECTGGVRPPHAVGVIVIRQAGVVARRGEKVDDQLAI